MVELAISGAFVSNHSVHTDSRGFFREWFKKSEFQDRGVKFVANQANFSVSNKGVLRGVHFSISEQGQAKVVTCVHGEILDVIVDLRLDSPTYLNIEKIALKAESGDALYIPSGVGHSFVVLSDSAAVVYLTSSEFDSETEKTISPIDPELGIEWPDIKGVQLALSERDLNAPSLAQAKANGDLPSIR